MLENTISNISQRRTADYEGMAHNPRLLFHAKSLLMRAIHGNATSPRAVVWDAGRRRTGVSRGRKCRRKGLAGVETATRSTSMAGSAEAAADR